MLHAHHTAERQYTIIIEPFSVQIHDTGITFRKGKVRSNIVPLSHPCLTGLKGGREQRIASSGDIPTLLAKFRCVGVETMRVKTGNKYEQVLEYYQLLPLLIAM